MPVLRAVDRDLPDKGVRMQNLLRERYDAVIVGGGAAGLSAALVLGRSCRSVLIIDAGGP